MPILRTRSGHELLGITPADRPTIPVEDAHIPFTFTMVVARYEDSYVMFYNRNRKQWEIAGGGIEAGETADDCALRELREETSQSAAQLTCRGIFKVRLGSRVEYGAVYEAIIDALQPFTPNNEAERIAVCRKPGTLDGFVSELSQAMIDFVSQAR